MLYNPVVNGTTCNCDKCGLEIEVGQKMYFFRPGYAPNLPMQRQCYPSCITGQIVYALLIVHANANEGEDDELESVFATEKSAAKRGQAIVDNYIPGSEVSYRVDKYTIE